MTRFLSFLGILSRRARTGFYLTIFFAFSLGSGLFFNAQFDLLDFKALQYDESALDTAFAWRTQSPINDPNILIVEIDEASLAHFARFYGRWPWPRHVFAETLAGLSEYEPKSITFNVMFSDLDLKDPDSDSLFNSIIAETENVFFPATRLSKKNDPISEVLVSQLPFAKVVGDDQTLAVLLTIFEAASKKMAINNLIIDDDGIVRRYSGELQETNFSLLTLPAKVGELESSPISGKEFLINWPTSLEKYQSISFKDLYVAIEEGNDQLLEVVRKKHIILGATASGLSLQRPTPVSPVTEDTRILAAIADNIVHESGLKTVPPAIILALSILTFAILSSCFIFKIDDGLIDSVFVAIELASIFITIGSISYSSYAIDLSFIIFVGLIYFATCKIYDVPVKSSERAYRAFFDGSTPSKFQYFSVIIFQSEELDELLRALGVSSRASERIFLIDEFISSPTLFQEEIVDSEVLILLHDEEVSAETLLPKFTVSCNARVNDDFQANSLRRILSLYNQRLEPSEKSSSAG